MVRLSSIVDRDTIKEKTSDKNLFNKAGLGSTSQPVHPEATIVSPQQIYNSLINYMEGVGESVVDDDWFDIQKGVKFIRYLVSKSHKNVLQDLHDLTLLSAGSENDTYASNAVNVAINALRLGESLGYTKREMIDLGSAALFHELGMYKLPESVKWKVGRFTEEDLAIMQTHCAITRDIVLEYGNDFHEIAEIIYQEHERSDGSGYPNSLHGNEIRESASIIGILDNYDALVNSRTYREGLLPSDAMKEIIRRCKGLFPVKVIKRLLKLLTVYPLRSYVRLNNGSIGMVKKVNTLWPLKPTVKIIHDAQGKRVEGERVIDLASNPLLYVKEVIRESDVVQ